MTASSHIIILFFNDSLCRLVPKPINIGEFFSTKGICTSKQGVEAFLAYLCNLRYWLYL